MRDHWIDEHVGDEATVRPGFEAELADTLHAAWADGPAASVALPTHPVGPSRRARVLIWAAAAAVVLGGGAVVLTQDGKSHITTNTGVETVAPSSSAPSSNAPSSTDVTTTEAATTVLATTPSVAVAHTPEEQTVLDYLTALADGRYDDAALLLGQGGLELEARGDLRPLLQADGTLSDLAAALKTWCESPAMCQLPTTLTTTDSRVVATFTIDGVERSTVFAGATFEGSPLVQGLPLRLPPAGVSISETVECPTSNIDDTAFADLDGDGWPETITLDHSNTGGSNGPSILHVCGTTTVVPPYTGPFPGAAAPSRVFALDIEGDGKYELLVGYFDPDTFSGRVFAFDGAGFMDTGRSVSQSALAATSYGCVDGDGDGTRDLVSYTYNYVGGSDLSNSTALNFVQTILLTGGRAGAAQLQQFQLPAQETEAFHLIAGYCGAVSVQTG